MQPNTFRIDIRGAEAHVRVLPDAEALSHTAAAYLIAAIETELTAGSDRFSFVLTGGSSPVRLYELLASDYAARIPWERVHLFWGDDRYVSPQDPASNQGQAYRTLIDHVPIPVMNVHPMPVTVTPPAEAARQYEQVLRDYFDGGRPAFDLVLLGLGEDGHVASLFPEDAPQHTLDDPAAAPWVEAVVGPLRHHPRQRLTLTLPTINEAKRVLFIVPGAKKREAVAQIVRKPGSTLPGAFVTARDELVWYVDEAAWGTPVAGQNDGTA